MLRCANRNRVSTMPARGRLISIGAGTARPRAPESGDEPSPLRREKMLSNDFSCARIFLRLPAAQTQSIADDDQIRKSHCCGAKDWTEKTERCQWNACRIIKKSPKQILLDGA